MVSCGDGFELGLSGASIGEGIYIRLNNTHIFWFSCFHWWLSHGGFGFDRFSCRGDSLYWHRLVMGDGF